VSPRLREDDEAARDGLVAAHNHVDIDRIEPLPSSAAASSHDVAIRWVCVRKPSNYKEETAGRRGRGLADLTIADGFNQERLFVTRQLQAETQGTFAKWRAPAA
jgi:hypothetical protein